MSTPKPSSTIPARTRRRAAGTAAAIRVLPPRPRRTVKASRRAYFELYGPRITFSPWLTKRDWRASRPKFFAAVVLLALGIGFYQLFHAPEFFVTTLEVSGTRL